MLIPIYVSSEKDMNKYDVVIIGGGFTGSEAAMASARNGAKTLMITISMDSIAAMPFGNILGGGKNVELLNKIKNCGSVVPEKINEYGLIKIQEAKNKESNIGGSIVVDRKKYSLKMKEVIENTENIDIRQGLVVDITIKDKGFEIIMSDYSKFCADTIVLCTGTFLNSRIFWGENVIEGGRQGEIRSLRLATNLINMGFNFFKKYIFIAPEVKKGTIDFKNANINIKNIGIEYLEVSPGEVIRRANTGKNIKKLYILPESRNSDEMYIYGFENSFSEERQEYLLKTIEGFEKVFITRPGYGIEYSCLSPFQINETLESKKVKGLFFAGRINRTCKYEESLEQGLLAGINASKKIKKVKMLRSI